MVFDLEFLSVLNEINSKDLNTKANTKKIKLVQSK